MTFIENFKEMQRLRQNKHQSKYQTSGKGKETIKKIQTKKTHRKTQCRVMVIIRHRKGTKEK